MDLTLDAGVEQALAAVAERALRCGSHAGMELLLRETLRLTEASGAALYDGRTCVARAGTGVAGPSSGGGRLLKVWPERTGRSDERVLERLSAFASALLAAHARESAAEARHARLLASRREQERNAARWEQRRSLAAHDLRTPLMVIKGYLDMMMKGTAGPLSATMQRYLDRMMRSAQDQRALIDFRLGRGSATDLCPLLHSAFGPDTKRASRWSVALAVPDRAVMVKASPAQLEAWVRALVRGLASTHATSVTLQLELLEPMRCWRLAASTEGGREPGERPFMLLGELTRRLGGSVRSPAPGVHPWVLQLPAELGPPGASGS
ncbi:histidine kinase dimerization/phospho-acceptor domain-containing protein [Myxococcus sp. CA039A]|uniref:histidine kinase dimerization/phospho-acceptor domain-containing protein n=1 Tax=Myxococcus sp. CA039A TaxID=2741737 RepID=UPI00157A73A5|nr:histidine kinase [Myxococcus sp. CA039A]